MKKIMLVLGMGAAVMLAGCNKGGTSDQYGTSSGGANSSSNSAQQGGANSSSNSPANP